MKLEKILLDSLNSNDSYEKFNKLDEDQMLERIIPQVRDMKLVGECKYHVVNCFKHSLYALQEFDTIISESAFFSSHLEKIIKDYLSIEIEVNISRISILRLGILLHDMGKPECKTVDNTGRIHFRNHEKVGAIQAKDIGKKLNLSSESIEILYKYVRYHMTLLSLYKANDLNQSKLYEIFNILEDEIIGVVILGYVDIVSTRKLLNPGEDSGVIKTYMEYILTNYLYKYKQN